MDPTEVALLAALREKPDEDTLRLELADFYAESGRPDDEWRQRELIAVRPVLAVPDEDTPRLEFADFCDRHGRHARARWIRASIALTKLTPCPRWCDHSPARCDRVRYSNEIDKAAVDCSDMWNPTLGRWLVVPPIVPMVRTGHQLVVRRGFGDQVFCRGPMWMANAHDLLARHPVQRAYLYDPPEFAHVAESDQFGVRSYTPLLWRLVGQLPNGDPYPVRRIRGRDGAGRLRSVREIAHDLLTLEFPTVTFSF